MDQGNLSRLEAKYGEYDFESFLGRGCFGRVYKVSSRKDGRRYALKVMEMDSYRVKLRDFLLEFDLVSSLDHPNIINVYKWMYTESVDDPSLMGSIAIQMEYCPNGDLKRFLLERNGLYLKRRKLLLWMWNLSSALEYMHQNNVLHRDLKPDNILLDRYHVLRISDFGIARIMSQYYYQASARGNQHFVAPEVVQNQRYTKKADVYALGKVFVCMSTLQQPPRGNYDLPAIYEDSITDVIDSCLQSSARTRPSSFDLCRVLEALN